MLLRECARPAHRVEGGLHRDQHIAVVLDDLELLIKLRADAIGWLCSALEAEQAEHVMRPHCDALAVDLLLVRHLYIIS
ncbi:MAG TPA: hypothetical protein DGT21_25850 [Armatimonadetes bacterium]|nr:hypothetical protein [Armatimonadota bacterium]